MDYDEMEEWIGKKVRVLDTCPDWGGGERVGVVMEVIKELGPNHYGPNGALYIGPHFKLSRDYQGNSSAVWYVCPDCVELIEPLKPIKPITLYPHKCKTCKAPARINRAISLCSNSKCKSRRLFNAIYHRTPPPKLKDRYVRCPECSMICTGVISYDRMVALCGMGHRWTHRWQVNDLIKCGGQWYRLAEELKFALTLEPASEE